MTSCDPFRLNEYPKSLAEGWIAQFLFVDDKLLTIGAGRAEPGPAGPGAGGAAVGLGGLLPPSPPAAAGGGNDSTKRRVHFYVSFRRRGKVTPSGSLLYKFRRAGYTLDNVEEWNKEAALPEPVA